MKKLIFALTIVTILLTSCADDKTFDIKGKQITVESYGWANENAKKVEGVTYQVCFGNMVWSILGFETIIVPIWLTGYHLWEPIDYKDKRVKIIVKDSSSSSTSSDTLVYVVTD